jgi:Nif-specific regulatory protein
MFLADRIGAHEGLAFLQESKPDESLVSVPVKLGDTPLGSLTAETKSGSSKEFLAALQLIASMVAQAMRVENTVGKERRKLIDENSHLKQELREKYDFSRIIGNSSPMRQVLDQVTQVARSYTTVLLRGESGTGKELIAHSIHYNSLRAKKPYVKINCAALPEALIESELFGYEKGAFTGADKQKKGRFEAADGGTLFLDEIGDLPPQTQVKLLRVLQEREFERLGGHETISVNVRLITATNKDLEEEIAAGKFREDLYYRLNVFQIFLPPLRERKSDILLLAEHFVEKYEVEYSKRIRRISTPAIDMLTSYHWPGNVRELENVIARAVLVCDSSVIHGHHLPPTLQTAEVTGTQVTGSLAASVESFERDLIQDALKSTRGNIAKAARLLDSTERIIGYKVSKYAIDPSRFR